jgi:DCN1-like protein 1/2
VETVSYQKEHISDLIKALKSDMALFKRVYRYTFTCTRESGQRSLPVENALVYWGLLFQSPGVPWVTASTNWLELWGEFLRAKWNKTVNRDMWNQTFEFFLKTMEDETLSFWNENSAWPGVIDDFVAYVKEKRGDTKEGTEDE